MKKGSAPVLPWNNRQHNSIQAPKQIKKHSTSCSMKTSERKAEGTKITDVVRQLVMEVQSSNESWVALVPALSLCYPVTDHYPRYGSLNKLLKTPCIWREEAIMEVGKEPSRQNSDTDVGDACPPSDHHLQSPQFKAWYCCNICAIIITGRSPLPPNFL